MMMDHTTQLDSSNANLSSSRGREEEGEVASSSLNQNRRLSTINPLQFHHLHDGGSAQPALVRLSVYFP